MQHLHCTYCAIILIFVSMNVPDYPKLSAKLAQQSQAMCRKCGLTVLRQADRAKPCVNDCPAQTLMRNAERVLRDFIAM